MHARLNPVDDGPGTLGGARCPHPARAALAALLLGAASAVHAVQGDPGCAPGVCSPLSDPTAIRQAVRDVLRETDRKPFDGQRARTGATPLGMQPPASSVWERQLGGPGASEDYNCALSAGVGGTLGGDHFLATRALGRTRIWRGK